MILTRKRLLVDSFLNHSYQNHSHFASLLTLISSPVLHTLIALNRSDVAWPKFNLVLWNAGWPFRIIVISAHLF